ncbi:MAG: Flp family type IVb pilin [Sphingomonadales bacterium]|nr:MAG: Flp family type IVb pilin [Sphingomonadales bacterium]
MRAMARLFAKLIVDRRAATAVEYGLIVSLIVLALIAGITSLASTTTSMWNNVSTKVQNAR